jgi:hypothetical protein
VNLVPADDAPGSLHRRLEQRKGVGETASHRVRIAQRAGDSGMPDRQLRRGAEREGSLQPRDRGLELPTQEQRVAGGRLGRDQARGLLEGLGEPDHVLGDGRGLLELTQLGQTSDEGAAVDDCGIGRAAEALAGTFSRENFRRSPQHRNDPPVIAQAPTDQPQVGARLEQRHHVARLLGDRKRPVQQCPSSNVRAELPQRIAHRGRD